MPTVFCSDSHTAGKQADGSYGATVSDESFANLRAIFQGLEGSLRDGLTIQHVKGHTNDPWNDLVDIIAKQESIKSFYHRRQSLDMNVWRSSLKHLWMRVTPQVGLPTFDGSAFDVSAPSLPQPMPQPPEIQYYSKAVHFKLSFATANVNSLHTGPEGYSGKLQFIRDQMKQLHLLCLGVQESRSVAVCSTTEEVLRLGGGSSKGHFGVELWINLRQPFAWLGRRPLFLSKQNVVVVHSTSRHLLAKVTHEHWKAWLLVAHAPQSGQADVQRKLWWDEIHEVLQQFLDDSEFFVMLDANAEPGKQDQTHVGSRDTEPSKSTPYFRDFLQTWKLMLPCTFPCHVGAQATWIAPDGASQHCIDHVCVPLNHHHDCTFSRVLTEFDFGNGLVDHSATAVQIEWTQVMQVQKHRKVVTQIQRNAISRDLVQPWLQPFVVPDWKQDIQTHVSTHNAHLLYSLQNACPQKPAQPKKSFITEEIWQLRESKLQHKKAVQQISERLRAETLRATWLEWKNLKSQNSTDSHEHGQVFQRYEVALRCWRLRQGISLHVSAVRLKKALRKARRQAIQHDLMQTSSTADAATILQTIKQHVGSTNLKSLKKPTLPMLNMPDGTPCTTPEQLCQTWVDFFGQMEGGQKMSWTDLDATWRESLTNFMQPQLTLGADDIPSLTELEMAFRRVKKGKAQGQDQIPPEVCHACPTLLAKQYYSALMKLVCHGQESLHHKGGILIPAYKGKGATTDPTAYRSLLISSHMGKVLHRAVRQHQAHLYEQYLCAQQLGGRRKVPVTLGLHEARAFLRGAQMKGLSVGLLMVDLTEAFYRVLRPLQLVAATAISSLLALYTNCACHRTHCMSSGNI